ncbi:ABC transporter permease [Ruminococcaceae bacterium OttesenSCG-928-D13]|nr:ABC transporter permease [Ruminococcaceae bacterium OttesenSCG-928-D13]
MTSSKKLSIGNIVKNYTLEIILVALAIILTFVTPHFLTLNNLMNILRNISLQGVVAFGMTIVIVCGELDLSLSSSIALTGVLIGLIGGKLDAAGIMPLQYGVLVGIAAAFVVCTCVGLINGWLITRFRIPAMIVTLAMQNILYGIAAIISNGFPVITFPAWYSFIGSGRIFGIVPVPVIILAVVFAITAFVLSYTKFGRATFACGGNAEAARLSGINVKRTKIISMVIVQLCCVVSGIMLSSQVMSGTFSFARGWEMNAISSVIIGGASIAGGIGKMRGTLLGIIFLGILLNGMTLLNVNDYIQYVVRGCLIIFAVLLSTLKNKK